MVKRKTIKDRLNFIAPLWNVDQSILNVRLPGGYQIEAHPAAEIISLLDELDYTYGKRLETDFIAEYRWVSNELDTMYVITNSFEVPGYTSKKSINQRHKAEISILRAFVNQIKLLRLYKSGNVFSPAPYLYEFTGKELTECISMPDIIYPTPELYHLEGSEILELNALLANYTLPFACPYINLAFEQFDASYALEDKLAFLSLMIAAEIIFNDGKQELRYKIARGTAVLLGTTENESWGIFKNMKALYDKRSSLVHTGGKSEFNNDDLNLLRSYIRKSILLLLNMNSSKENLMKLLTGSGFGQINRD
jgi:hypothetical protein